MRVKCDSLGILTEDYILGRVVKTAAEVFTGMSQYLVDDALIDRFYEGEEIFLEKQDIDLMTNQFVMLVSNSNDKKSALARFYDYNRPLKRMNGDWKDGVW